MQVGEFSPHLCAQPGIEIGQRFVEKEQARLAHDRPSDRHTLALAARQFTRLAVHQFGQTEQFARLSHAVVDGRARTPCHQQREGDVLGDRHLRIECIGLEHHRHPALARRQVVDPPVADANFPAIWPLEARNQPQQRRLATSRGADKNHEFAVPHRKIEALEQYRRSEALADPG